MRLIVDVEMGIPILLQVALLVDSDEGSTVRGRFRRDDEGPANGPVIASVSLMEVGPPKRADRKYTVILLRKQVGEFTPAHSTTSFDCDPRRNSTWVYPMSFR